ncbi:hypothetical protein [Arthrobacter woluwensis]|uniref:hypothetical protein n=1 Tax=Arthrobacter woluwensis TaxID=156980 RepID=UPI00119EBC12|nr:hypothetical protein [Arthrobacter woluwensis]
MADDCTCPWDVEEIGGGYVRGILRKQPDCPGHGGTDGEVVRITDGYADDLRRAKHLTDAECAAMYWASHGVDTMGEGDKHWSRHSRRLTLRRFAEHNQAV